MEEQETETDFKPTNKIQVKTEETVMETPTHPTQESLTDFSMVQTSDAKHGPIFGITPASVKSLTEENAKPVMSDHEQVLDWMLFSQIPSKPLAQPAHNDLLDLDYPAEQVSRPETKPVQLVSAPQKLDIPLLPEDGYKV